jgi:hypothetical protein
MQLSLQIQAKKLLRGTKIKGKEAAAGAIEMALLVSDI